MTKNENRSWSDCKSEFTALQLDHVGAVQDVQRTSWIQGSFTHVHLCLERGYDAGPFSNQLECDGTPLKRCWKYPERADPQCFQVDKELETDAGEFPLQISTVGLSVPGCLLANIVICCQKNLLTRDEHVNNRSLQLPLYLNSTVQQARNLGEFIILKTRTACHVAWYWDGKVPLGFSTGAAELSLLCCSWDGLHLLYSSGIIYGHTHADKPKCVRTFYIVHWCAWSSRVLSTGPPLLLDWSSRW